MKTIWVRHGQSEYNAENRSTGWHDPDLTQLGIEQALTTATELVNNYQFIAEIHCSDLRRSYYTAKIILDSTPWFKDIKIDALIRERDYGIWSGRNKEDLFNELGEKEFMNIRRGWNNKPEDGESLKECASRVATFINGLEDSPSLPHIIVCHGNTIRAASVVLGKNTAESVRDWEIETGEFVEWDC
jgi:2,3-bisphosphoglycerate-dependent phosphoglycerate mutase|tara:strand:- start:1821 stop:2381 length:561 start_codon:yes stop_codon:yes gene_type:complete